MEKYNGEHMSEIDVLKIMLIVKILYTYYLHEDLINRKKTYEINENENNNDKNIILDKTNGVIANEKKYREVDIELPIIISEKTISIPLEHNMELKDFILEVRGIKNLVYLTDYKVFPLMLPNREINLSQGKIFIEGQLKNTVEYCTVDEISKGSIGGYLRYTTSIIPFNCTALVNFSHSPLFNKINLEGSKGKIHCSIKDAQVYISNSFYDFKSISNIYDLGKVFKKINQKIMLKITICLTQRQEIKMLRKNN